MVTARHAVRKSRWSAGLAAGGVALAAFGLMGPAQADNHNPPGNNGTVKVNGDENWSEGPPSNEPHPDKCIFRVDFYGFDQGVGNATVTFDLQAPTATANHSLTVTTGDLTPDIGEDAAGGETDLDASEVYTLAFTGDPQPNQGYHVKLTVDAPGSIGA